MAKPIENQGFLTPNPSCFQRASTSHMDDVMAPKRYCSKITSVKMLPPRAAYSDCYQLSSTPGPNKQINTRKTPVGKEQISRGLIFGETVVQRFRNRMYFSKLLAHPALRQLRCTGPLCFLGCVFLWSPWLVRSHLLSRESTPDPIHHT